MIFSLLTYDCVKNFKTTGNVIPVGCIHTRMQWPSQNWSVRHPILEQITAARVRAGPRNLWAMETAFGGHLIYALNFTGPWVWAWKPARHAGIRYSPTGVYLQCKASAMGYHILQCNCWDNQAGVSAPHHCANSIYIDSD